MSEETILMIFRIFACHMSIVSGWKQTELLTLFWEIGSAIVSEHQHCSHLKFTYESSLQIPLQLLPAMTKNCVYETNLIPDFSLALSDQDLTSLSTRRDFYKHHQPCNIVFYEIPPEFPGGVEMLNNGTIGDRWPERFVSLLAAHVMRSFFIFFSHRYSHSELEHFMKETGMMLHSLFIIPESTKIIGVYNGLPKTSLGLAKVATFTAGGLTIFKELFRKKYDFNGEPIISLFCPVCGLTEEEVTGEIPVSSPFKSMWLMLARRLNTSLHVETIFGIPAQGLTEHGGFDDFLLPLLEGTAATTSLLLSSIQTFPLVHYSKPYYFDSVIFLTARPKALKSGGIYMIEEPLDWPVWIAVIVSSICTYACLELIMRTTFYTVDIDLRARLLQMVYKPMLVQEFYASSFEELVRPLQVRFVLGIWSLCVIVLVCAYNSALLDCVAFPRYVLPPQNLRELADSDYEIGVIATGPLLHDLRVTNISSYIRIAERLVEHDILSSTCYQSIFERKMACMGLSSALLALGMEFVVDVKGRMLAAVSKDKQFLTLGMVGVSKYYPMLLEPLNEYIDALSFSGLHEYARKKKAMTRVTKGKAIAKEAVSTKKYYLGYDESGEEEHDLKLVGVFKETITVCLAISTAVFLAELAIHFITVCRPGKKLLPIVTREQAFAYMPQIYVSEFHIAATATVAAVRIRHANEH